MSLRNYKSEFEKYTNTVWQKTVQGKRKRKEKKGKRKMKKEGTTFKALHSGKCNKAING